MVIYIYLLNQIIYSSDFIYNSSVKNNFFLL